MRKSAHSFFSRPPVRRARAVRRPPRPELEQRLEPPRGAADLGGPDRGQHRPVRVPQPGQAGHAHDRLELDPRRGSGGGAELLHVLARPRGTTSTSTATATGSRTSPTTSSSRRRPARTSSATRSRRWTAKRNGKAFANGKTPIDNIGPRFNGFVEVKDYDAAAEGDRQRRTACRSSPASVTTRSSPTSARSSTSSRSARRARRATRAAARTSCPATTSTRSPCRSRSRRSTTPSHTIGVWAATDRQNVTVERQVYRGWTQVSRLGEPLINEVVIPTGLKDLWNRTDARTTTRSSRSTTRPRSWPPC